MPFPPSIATWHSRAAALALLVLGFPVAGCSNVNRAVATSPIPPDYHLRHPVVLANSRHSLDIFLVPASDKLDARQTADVRAFAADYLANGEGRIQVQVPRGAVNPRAADATLAALRRALAASGVKGEIEVGTYQVFDPAIASALRLNFTKLQARVASRCGEWPDDLGSGSTLNTWDNRAYYNFGCATQQTLAAQVDDPRDLVRPRAESPPDVNMRTRAITGIRAGADPSTTWKVSVTPVGGAGQ
jgi:pilus assembly protein CpaD